jgi:hypothetical protein
MYYPSRELPDSPPPRFSLHSNVGIYVSLTYSHCVYFPF